MRQARSKSDTAQLGFTLVEMMIVIAIIALMLGSATLAVRNVARSDLRSAASRSAATLRFAFDRATMTGNYIRVVFDMERDQLWLEASEDRVALRRGSQQHHTTDEKEAGQADDDAPAPKPVLPFGAPAGKTGDGDSDSDGDGDGDSPLGIDTAALKRQYERDLEPVERPKALFRPLKKKIKLAKGIHIAAVMTPRMVEPVEQGKGYVYFFPQGHSEPAIIHFVDNAGEYYSVVMHPLTGRTKVYPCRYKVPDDFGVSDDQRRRRSKRDDCAKRGP